MDELGFTIFKVILQFLAAGLFVGCGYTVAHFVVKFW